MKDLTLKQRRYFKAWMKHGNKTQAAKNAGYNCKTENAFAQRGHKVFEQIKPYVDKWLDEEGLGDQELKRLLIDGLQAKQIKFFSHQGEIVDQIDVIAWGPRQKFLDMAMRHRDLYAAERLKIDGDLTIELVNFSDEDEDSE